MTSENENWLPALILLQTYGGSWDRFIEVVYSGFRADFIDSQPKLENRRCGCKRHPVIKGKEATFWHLISEGTQEEERTPDLRRCERIRWPRAIIERIPKKGVRRWRSDRPGDKGRIVLALEDFSYVVVLADRGDYVLLWTAFPVERAHRRRKLQEEANRSGTT